MRASLFAEFKILLGESTGADHRLFAAFFNGRDRTSGLSFVPDFARRILANAAAAKTNPTGGMN